MSALCYLYFIVLTYICVNLLYKPFGIITSPFDKTVLLKCTGLELFFYFIFSTGLLGLQPVLALRLASLEFLCLVALFKSKERPVYSVPMCLFCVFLLWTFIGLSYSVSLNYGIRMILKYLYPLLVGLVASAVVRDVEIFIKSALVARFMAILSIIVIMVPFIRFLFGSAFWHMAALGTHYGIISIVSLTFYFYTNEKFKSLLLLLATALMPFIWVFRTNIMELMVGVALFFFIKYHLKSIPILLLLAVLSIASIFYIPAVKNKMFFNPDKVTLEKYINGEIDEEDVNTSGRKFVWEDIINLYEKSPVIGNGTGRVQYRFNNEYTGWQFGGQLHNDMLVLLCDNGIVGLSLYFLAILAVFVHCFIVFHQRCYGAPIKMLALIAGPTMVSVTLTMYSDNTISYSMCTLSYPWGFYGMMLGLIKSKKYG